MSDTFLSALTAAGGNSRAARSARAKLQWRDRFGRWIEMGRGVKFKVRGSDGATRSVIGSFVGAIDAETGQVYVSKDPNGMPDGFYDINSNNAQEFVANLTPEQLAGRGIELGKDASGNAVGERIAEDIPNINELTVKDAPAGWVAQPGTFGGKKVMQTDDGDFRVHYAGKDDTVLLEDSRSNPGQADPQRSLAEAFKKVADVDIQREQGGDQAYVGISDGAAEAVDAMGRDDLIDQIKFQEKQLQHPKVTQGGMDRAYQAINRVNAQLAEKGFDPYDPEGNDSDEALAARKAATPEAGAPADPNAATPAQGGAPAVSTGDIDVSTFDVSPEGFLVPTGKQTNDISPQGLANFMTAEKEALGKGGARLVVDTDAGTAEIHNSADTFDNAKAQAGGIGVPEVLDLQAGKAVSVAEGDVVDPNSPEVNPNLDGATVNAPTGGAPDAEDRSPDAVEPGTDVPGADAPVRDQPDAEAGRSPQPDPGSVPDAPAGDPAADPQPDGDPARPDAGTDSPSADTEPSRPSAAPGSVEELKERRTQVQAALDVAGDPKDIIALNEQADELDARIRRDELGAATTEGPKTGEEGAPVIAEEAPAADAPEAPEAEAPDVEARLTELAGEIKNLEDQNDRLQKDLDAGTSGRSDEEISAEIDEVFNKVADLQSQFDELENGPTDENTQAEETLAGKLDSAWLSTDPYPDSWIEKRERAALRILRDAEAKGDLEKGLARLSQEEKDALSDDIAAAVGIDRSAPEPEPVDAPEADAPEAPETPQDAPEVSPEPVDAPEPAAPATERPAYEEPGNAEAVSAARNKIAELDAGIADMEADAAAAENAGDFQAQAVALSRIRTMERDRRVQENALNKALGNSPMDFNGDLGWNMRNPDNRGSLPEAPEAPEPTPEPEPEADTPAVLDADISPDSAPDLQDIGPSSLRVGDFIEHPVTGNIVRITNIDAERYPEEGATKFTISFESRNDLEEGENEAAGNVELWSTDQVSTFKGWREQPNNGVPEETEEVIPEIVSVLQKQLAGESLDAEEQKVLDAHDAERANRTLEDDLADAETTLQALERDYTAALLEDDFDDEEIDQLAHERDWARYEIQNIQDRIEERDFEARAEGPETDADRAAESAEREFREEGPLSEEEFEELVDNSNVADDINAAVEERDTIIDQIDPSEGAGGAFAPGDDPINVSPGHDNAVEVAKAKLRGKQMSADERDALQAALESGVLTDNEVARISAEIDSKPNAANTITITRPDTEQPDYMSTADLDIVNMERADPNFVFDEDLTARRIREEFPDAVELENGDLVLDESVNKGKRYQTVIRRTAKNRFMVYILETDSTGNRRAKRIGNTEWHSYEALEKRITQGRKLIHSKSPAGSLARRKDQPTEFLGTQGFPQDDFLGDIGNPEAPIPATGDEKFDNLLAVAAGHIRNGDADLAGIEESLQKLDPGANAINTIMDAIIGRAQDQYRPDGVNPWQTYDGELAEIGGEYDWTNWHEFLNWWLPNGQLNKDRIPNPNYGQVERVRVMKYVEENTDGKGHTYGDHVWVSVYDAQTDTWGNWVKRSAQTLRKAEPGSDTGAPFFSKKEEWRTDPEALARRFRVPNASADEPVQTKERPSRELPTKRRLRFTSRGNLSGYSNVPVPNSPAEIGGMIANGEVLPSMTSVADLRPGMLIVRKDDNGFQHADSIIRVENLGDGGYRIHAARPDGTGSADVENFILPGNMDVAAFSSPALPAPRRAEPKNARRGELVEFEQGNGIVRGVVAFDDDQGNLTVITPGNVPIDILESNIKPVDAEVSKDDRLDLLDSIEDYELPPYIKNMITQGVLSPSLTREFYELLQDVIGSFGTRSPQIREVDEILDMIGASAQQRADVHEYFAA